MLLENNTENICPERGLPEELFLEISALMPVPNVDLLILNEKHELLLTWRDDIFFGNGWHLPGGCIRLRETMLERVHKTAISELGCDVIVDEAPVAVRDVIINGIREKLENQRIRSHQLAVLYKCCLIDPDNKIKKGKPGEMQWFRSIPENILTVHDVYRDVFEKFGLLNQ